MQRFQYVARSLEGGKMKGEVMADSVEEATARLQEAGVYVTSLVPLRKRKPGPLGGFLIPESERQVLLESWAVFLEAGISMQSALLRIRLRTRSAGLARAIEQLQESIDQGKPFSESVKASRIFPPSWVAVLSVGEMHGNYVQPLRLLIKYANEARHFRNELIAMLIMPAILLFMIGIWFWLFLVRVLPSIIMLASQGSGVPKMVVYFMYFANFVKFIFPWMLLVISGVGLWVLLSRRADQEMGMLQSWIPINTPIIGPLVSKMQLIVLATGLQMQMEAGIPLLSAIEALRYGVSSRQVRQDLLETYQKLLDGTPVPEAMAKIRVIPDMGHALIAAGDASGKMPELLAAMARDAQSTLMEEIKRLIVLIRSFVILAAGVLIGLLMVVFFSILFGGLSSYSGTSTPTAP